MLVLRSADSNVSDADAFVVDRKPNPVMLLPPPVMRPPNVKALIVSVPVETEIVSVLR